jgi:hypothetical protein
MLTPSCAAPIRADYSTPRIHNLEEDVMKVLPLLTALCVLATSAYLPSAYAQSPTCKAQAGDKKLAGAALTSFMKKCQSDAAKSCDASAADKKLSGAAKTSFTKKCVSDTVGS